nr:hypothetical protein [Tanacetum cinerariifolium]
MRSETVGCYHEIPKNIPSSSFEIVLSASSKTIFVSLTVGSLSFFQIDNGIRLMLAPKSARAKQLSNSEKSQGIRNLPGSPSFSASFLKTTAEQFSFNGVLRLDVFGAWELRIRGHLCRSKEFDGKEEERGAFVFALELVVRLLEYITFDLLSIIDKHLRGILSRKFPPAAESRA